MWNDLNNVKGLVIINVRDRDWRGFSNENLKLRGS